MNNSIKTQEVPYCQCRVARYGQKLILLTLFCGLLAPLFCVTTSRAAGRPPMPVETMQVKVADAQQQLTAVGSLQSNESVVLSSEISGRIVKISFSEGQAVKAGKLLIQLDDSVLKAQMEQAQANLTLHAADYRRAEALLKEHAISQQERDTAYARWVLDRASVNLAKAQWSKTRIYVPFSGTLGLRRISLGDFVQPGQALVNLEDTSRIKVEFPLPEKYADSVRVGQKFRLRTASFAKRDFKGEIYAINPLVDTASRSLVVRGRLDNSAGLLRPGQFAKLRLTTARRKDALFIPEQAVIPQPQSNLVFKVVAGKAQMVPIKLGQRRKGWVEVVSGLAPGDVVVTGGQQKIGPGSLVQAIPADPALFAKN